MPATARVPCLRRRLRPSELRMDLAEQAQAEREAVVPSVEVRD
jgi:hypothetical protein